MTLAVQVCQCPLKGVVVRYRFITCDVFTGARFGGNQLAVVPEADGLSDEQMLGIAREFNYSETTFVLPPQTGRTCRVRIFTPGGEIPFAGHPNIGTAFVLALAGGLGALDAPREVVFEELAGPVAVAIEERDEGRIWCELTAPQSLSVGKAVSVDAVAAAASLTADDIVTTTHAPRVASVGLPFVLAELGDRAALERARPDSAGFERLAAGGAPPFVHLYVGSADGFDLRARMFAPLNGIPEDPATGSANCALAGLLSHLDERPNGAFRWRIAQGVEMGRPSTLEARTEKRDGTVVNVWIGGRAFW
jgi:trans-2,3-dihydro-3-hydroxyanthranilate isomerase